MAKKNPTIVTYNFLESPNLIVETVDLRRGFIEAFTIFGGFMIACYAIIFAMISICTKHETEKALVDDLYVLNGHPKMVQ